MELWNAYQKSGAPTPDCRPLDFWCDLFFYLVHFEEGDLVSVFLHRIERKTNELETKRLFDKRTFECFNFFFWEISSEILCEVFLGEAIKAATWNPFLPKNPSSRLSSVPFPACPLANEMVQRPFTSYIHVCFSALILALSALWPRFFKPHVFCFFFNWRKKL